MFDLPDCLDIPDVFFETPGLPMPQATTLLYGIQPRGLGTGACESLKSYISCLANEHRISPAILFSDILKARLVEHNPSWKAATLSMKNNHSFFISMGTLARELVLVLAEATGVNILANCTMLPMIGILNPQGLITVQERHCPLCLQEINNLDGIYGRLIWKISCITACPNHRVQLVPSQCGTPKETHLSLSHRKILFGVCSKCGSIGYQCRRGNAVVASEIEVWKAQQMADLIELFPLTTQLFSKEKTIAGLKSLANIFFDGKPAIAARRAEMNKSVLWGWMHGYNLPSLGLLLDLCLSAGVSLVSLMKGAPAKCISPQFKKSSYQRLVKKDKEIFSKEAREKSLKEALTINPPPSLATIASELNLHHRSLSTQFPELAALVVKRFRLFRSSQIFEKHKQAKVIAQNLIKEIIIKELPPTQSNFEKIAGKPLLPNNPLRWALLEMLPDHSFSAKFIAEDCKREF